MTPTQKFDLLVTHFADQNFHLLETVLGIPSEPVDVTFDTIISEGEHQGKTVLAVAMQAWEENMALQRAQKSYDANIERNFLNQCIEFAMARLLDTGSPATAALLCVLYESEIYKKISIYASYSFYAYDNCYVQLENLYSTLCKIKEAAKELTSDNPTLSQEMQDRLCSYITQASTPFKYCVAIIKPQLTQSQPILYNTIVQKIWSLKDHTRGAVVIPTLVEWMQLDARKWSIILSLEGMKYLSASRESTFDTSSDYSITCAHSIIISHFKYEDLFQLKRKLAVIIQYRLKCYLTQTTVSSFLNRYIGSEKKFYSDYLKLWLAPVVKSLHLEHNTNDDEATDFTWLKDIFYDCLNDCYYNQHTPAGYADQRTFRQMIVEKDADAKHVYATKLGEELSGEEDKQYSIRIERVFIDAINTRVVAKAPPASQELQLAVTNCNLSAVWELIQNNNQKISSLDTTAQKALLKAAQQEFITAGSEVGFEILCRFYDEELPMSADIRPTDSSDIVAAINQDVLIRMVALYMQQSSNNNAADFFAKLLDRNIMSINPTVGTLIFTIFHTAISSGYLRIVDLFIKCGINPNRPNVRNLTPVQSGLYQLSEEHLERVVFPPEVRQNIVAGLEKVINYHRLNWRENREHNREGAPLLTYALNTLCPADIVEILLNSPYCDPNYSDYYYPPLIHLIRSLSSSLRTPFWSYSPREKKVIDNNLKILQLLLAHPKIKFCEERLLDIVDDLRLFAWEHHLDINLTDPTLLDQARSIFYIADALINMIRFPHIPMKKSTIDYLNKIFAQNVLPDFCKTLFKNHFSASEPLVLGAILQQVRTLDNNSPIEQWMELSAAKWSRALSDAGKEYCSAATSELSVLCARKIQTKKPSIDELKRQFQIVLSYQLRCHLGDINKDKKFHTEYLASLMPHVTAFLQVQLSDSEPKWLNIILTTCLDELASTDEEYTLREAIVDNNLGAAMRQKLCTTFCVEIGQMFTRELNAFVTASYAGINNGDDSDDNDNNQLRPLGFMMRKK